jgi:hypothetical protein
MSKPERWYELNAQTGEVYVYNASNPKFATSCSTLRSLADLAYYRRNFTLRRVETA